MGYGYLSKALSKLSFMALLLCSSGFLSSCGTNSPATAEKRKHISAHRFDGVAAFAAMHPRFECDNWLTIMDQATKPVLAILWGTFGYDTRCLRKFTNRYKEKPHLIQSHLGNGSCRRKDLCLKGEMFPRDTVSEWDARLVVMSPETRATILNRVLELRVTMEMYSNSNTYLMLSLELEDNLSLLAAKNLLSVVREIWPYAISYNPLKSPRGNPLLVDYVEHHGLRTPEAPCIANLDGVSVRTDSNDPYKPSISVDRARGWWRGVCACDVRLLWHAPSQGLTDGFISPRDRNFHFTSTAVAQLSGLLAATC